MISIQKFRNASGLIQHNFNKYQVVFENPSSKINFIWLEKQFVCDLNWTLLDKIYIFVIKLIEKLFSLLEENTKNTLKDKGFIHKKNIILHFLSK